MNNEELRIKVVEALESDRYKWRTVKGIAKEIGVNEEQVIAVIEQNIDDIVQSSVSSNNGEDLYTTRDHFREYSSAFDKVIGAFKGRLR